MRARMWTTGLVATIAALLFAAPAGASDTVIKDSAVTAAGIAVDGSGDVFMADPFNNRVVVAKPDGTGGNTVSVVDDTVTAPDGVAVDSSGDVFIADNGNNRVVKDTPDGSGGYTQSIVDGNLAAPNGVAVDGSGDVYVADTGDDRVVEDVPDGSGGYAQNVVDSALSLPAAVAVDGSGDVFIDDSGNDRVVKDTPDGSGGYTQSVVTTGVTEAFGIAVDSSGAVYTNTTDMTDSSVLKLTPDGSGGYTQSTVDDGFYFVWGIAVDASNKLFVSDLGASQTWEEQPLDCGCYTRTLIDTGVVAPAAATLDRFGNVFIADTGNNRVLEEKPVGGGGFHQTVVDDQVFQPGAVAVDRSGDVFVADTLDDRVVEDKPNGHGGYIQSVVDTNVGVPEGVAVDASGNVFVSDTGNSRLVEDKPDGSGGYTQSVIDTGTTLNSPYGIALDRAGDVFIADAGNSRVVEAKADGSGGYSPVVIDDSSLGFPQGVAVDSQGWVFVGDAGNDQLVAEKPTNGSFTPAVIEPLASPGGLAVDPTGNLFVAESCGCGQVLEHPISLASVAVKVGADSTGKFTVTATARSPWGERLPTYSDSSPTWSDTASELGSQTPAPFAGGQSVTKNVVMSTPVRGDLLSVTTNGITGTSPPFSVAGLVTGFAYKLQKPVTAGQPYSLQVSAVDARGAVVTSYQGSPSWSDLSGYLTGSPAPFTNGVSSNSVTWPNAYHKDQVTVTDGTVTSQSPPFNVLGPLAGFSLRGDSPVLVNQAFTLRIWAVDALGDVITDYNGSPTWSDLSGSLPVTVPPNPFSGGLSTNTVTLGVPYHEDRITVTDGSVSSQSGRFNVFGDFSKFGMSIQTPVTSGSPFRVVVYAEDSAGNVVSGYSGSPTWSDSSGALSGSPAGFSNGASTNTVTLPSPFRKDRITVTDGTVTTTSSPFNVG